MYNPVYPLYRYLGYSETPDGQAESVSGAGTVAYVQESTLLRDRNFNVACETGIRYPAYEVMCEREQQVLRISVSQRYLYSCYPRAIP